MAAAGALLLAALGAVDGGDALDTVEELAPTIGFLAALLLIAEGCRRDGLFDAIGALLARRAGCSRSCSPSRRRSPRCSAATPRSSC